MTRLSIVLAVGLLWPTTAFCEDQDVEQISAAIDKCVETVRDGLSAEEGLLLFDAYYDPSLQQTKIFGTPYAQFQFMKCISQQGYPIWRGHKLILGSER